MNVCIHPERDTGVMPEVARAIEIVLSANPEQMKKILEILFS